MSDAKRLVFHIGLEKTGTSSLQACLHHNASILRRHSILYPSRNPAYGWMNHKPLVGCYAIDDVGDKWLEVDPSRRHATVATLVDEIEAAPARTAVISAEHFSSRFREPQIRELREDFARFDCRVAIVIRDHLSRLCSSYETYVTNGGTLPLDDYADGMMEAGALGLRYAEIVAPWERVFGRDRLDVMAYGPGVMHEVLARLDPGLAAEPRLRTFRLKVSAEPAVVEALRLANIAAAPVAPGDTAGWARETQRRAQVKAWLRRSACGCASVGWSLDPARRARLDAIAREDAAYLEARFGLVRTPRETHDDDGHPGELAADLLARALTARAAKPWARASLTGAGLAAVVRLRDEIARFRRRRSTGLPSAGASERSERSRLGTSAAAIETLS